MPLLYARNSYCRYPSKPKRAGDSKGRFGRSVRRNYRRATTWDLLGPGLLMQEGRLTKWGEISWALKIEKTYGRRGRYGQREGV